jgi:carboxypeptidase family protein
MRPVYRLCFISIALAAPALDAQQAALPIQPQPPKLETCSIEGRVISAVSGEGVRKVEIVVSGKENRQYSTTTGAGGVFAIEDIEPGRYGLGASKHGYAYFKYGARGTGRAGATLSLDPGQHVSDLVLALSPQAVITGRVLDEEGDPVRFIDVQLLKYSFHRGKRQLEQIDGGTTNDLGEYRLFGLSPGKYYLSATAEGMGSEEYGDQAYAPTYFPRASNPAGATAIEVRPGSLLRGVDFVLLRTRSVRVRGRVVDSTAKQATQGPILLEGMNVQLDPREEITWSGRSFGANSMDAQGNFEIRGVPPGAYVIHAYKHTRDKPYVAQQPIDVAGNDIENIVLELSPTAELKGQLRVEGRAPPSLGDVHVFLEPEGVSYVGGAGASVKADGGFTLPNVATAAHYDVNVSGLSEDYYIKSARLGDADVLDAGVEFAGSVTGQLEIVMSGNGGQVEGVVLNAEDQPATAATVELVPDAARRAMFRLYRQASTDQYGRFVIKGITPGAYKLFAWEDIADGQYEDPEFMKSCEGLGHPVGIRAGSRESAQLKMIPAEEKKSPPAN